MVSEKDLKLSGLSLDQYLDKCKSTGFTPETDERCACEDSVDPITRRARGGPRPETIEEKDMWSGNPPPLCLRCLRSI